ncbi:MAG: hypothetical protein R3E31_04750 [Chloroflexota bacterium]|nr:hypothetical protein [Anaerolineales bacterium]
MNQEQLWHELTDLPPAARQQVYDFIAFLRGRYAQTGEVSTQSTPDLRNEPFVGIWQDREDMNDSTTWVRESRQREWS